MNRWLALLVSCLALGLVAAGCGDDEEEGGGAAATTEQSTDTTGTGPTGTESEATETTGGSKAPETVTVDMRDIKFIPQDATVKAGGTVKWTNSDQVGHTVTKEKGPGPEFDSGNVAAGDEYEETFEEAGKIDYFCEIHPGQKGTLTVE